MYPKMETDVPEQASIVATSPSSSGITYFQSKHFTKAFQEALLKGGQHARKYIKVRQVLDRLHDPNPFLGLAATNHGETRIKHCVKYDLGDGWRLITRQDAKSCAFLFMGDHEDCDRWLDNRRGEDIGIKSGQIIVLPGIPAGNSRAPIHITTYHDKSLIDLLPQEDIDRTLVELPASLVRRLAALTGASTPEEVTQMAMSIQDAEKANFVLTVFMLLHSGNVDGARAHVDASRGDVMSPEDISDQDMVNVEDGDEIRRLRVGSREYETWLASFEKRSKWQDWFLFLHPEQEKVVKADYSGVSQLSGVSGSGKTCVAVRRAMRLAEAKDARVLLLTLNRSLAGLLQQLVESACIDESVRSRIRVTSLFGLIQELLIKFEPHNTAIYQDITLRLNEHVDEVFREYYRQWTNNADASVLLPLHKSMNARGVNGESYLREDFDWIRSAVHPEDRRQYLDLERKGRRFPIPADRREDLLKGLSGWERKMRDIGVVDYLDLTSALNQHLDEIETQYTNILVDEAQDFGTTELEVVRRLVKPGPNDIFLCGDIAQTILPKHRVLKAAGLAGVASERIRQNYRNSREILAAAYEVLKTNLHEEMFESGDLEILDPKFANFSGPAPIALAAESLEEEIGYARTYAQTSLDLGTKTVCIAFAGFSSRDIHGFAARCGVTALNGAYDPSSDRLVFSDLEQTKGYEFDCLIIVGCCEGVLPASDAPEEEAFRDTCKLYVSMTRAKRELILSFHGAASPWIRAVSDTIATETWQSYETLNSSFLAGRPEKLPELEPDRGLVSEGLFSAVGLLNGVQFLFTSSAVGLSLEAQDKLIDLVDGIGARAGGAGGRRLRWPNIRTLMQDLSASRRYDHVFGPNVAEELRAKLPS